LWPTVADTGTFLFGPTSFEDLQHPVADSGV
jgi:hypothetical protein